MIKQCDPNIWIPTTWFINLLLNTSQLFNCINKRILMDIKAQIALLKGIKGHQLLEEKF